MKLIRARVVGHASICWTQVEHRKTAMDYAIKGIGLVREKNAALFPDDQMFAEMEDTMRDWVIETLIQGAYIREYHLWEKDTKQYFQKQLTLNKSSQQLAFKSGKRGFIDLAIFGLSVFGAQVPPTVINVLDLMRRKVNSAKHDPGLLVGHFLTQDEYNKAVQNISAYWQELDTQENY